MLAKVVSRSSALSKAAFAKISHLLVVLPKSKSLPSTLPGYDVLKTLLARRGMQPAELDGNPLSAELGQGGLAAWVMADFAGTVFDRQTAIRKALQPLLAEKPASLDIVVMGTESQRDEGMETAVYCALINSKPLPARKKANDEKALEIITAHEVPGRQTFAKVLAVAEGNYFCRMLTMLPANDLTPRLYRRRLAELAKDNGWKREEFDLKKLTEMGAGAFLAVAQGSPEKDAAIVRLRYKHKQAKETIALVGKGICFDTGGHNLKPARGMLDMHKDMNGSAVALGMLIAATRLKLPINIDCWLAIAQNHLSPSAYKQSDVVTALNGTTIEVVHTDAEGRMVLADTLTLAARQKPTAIIDFATLTGAMVYALGTRYSGIFSNQNNLIADAVNAGKDTGERVNAFPLDADYEAVLKSEVADTKQCLISGEADHIIAARFLLKFVDDLPWMHMDLSSAECEGGLGAVATQTTGFGVNWGVEMISRMSRLQQKL
ncbi:MAG: leucyl aminopeptidase family protein [Pseudomonadota bacterium]